MDRQYALYGGKGTRFARREHRGITPSTDGQREKICYRKAERVLALTDA